MSSDSSDSDSEAEINPFVVRSASAPSTKKKKKKKKESKKKKKTKKKKKKKGKHKHKDGYDSDTSLSSGIEDGALAKDETDVKIFQDMFMKRDTSKVIAEASVYDRFSDNEESEEEEGDRLGPGLGKKENDPKREKRKGKQKDKKKKGKKKKEKKKKKKKSKKKGSSRDENSDSDDSDKVKEPSVRLDLPGATKLLKILLEAAASMKDELKGMFAHIDTGEELDVSGISNLEIRSSLELFFEALLFKKGPEGGWQASVHTPKLMDLFAPNIQRFKFVPKQKPIALSTIEEVVEVSSSSTEKVRPPKTKRPGPAMPSEVQIEEAKRLAEAKEWEKGDDEELDSDSEVDGPTLPGQNSKEKEMALEALRNMRERALEQKKLADAKPKHEGWMMSLPEERLLDGSMDQRGRTFSMKGVQTRGDTSEWTMTPEERRRKKAEEMFNMHAEIRAKPGPKTKLKLKRKRDEKEKQSETRQRGSALQEQKSLLQLHQQEQTRTKKKKQIGGTSSFSFKGMREDRQFNKKEAKNMKNAGKQLTMGFSSGQLYKSGM